MGRAAVAQTRHRAVAGRSVGRLSADLDGGGGGRWPQRCDQAVTKQLLEVVLQRHHGQLAVGEGRSGGPRRCLLMTTLPLMNSWPPQTPHRSMVEGALEGLGHHRAGRGDALGLGDVVELVGEEERRETPGAVGTGRLGEYGDLLGLDERRVAMAVVFLGAGGLGVGGRVSAAARDLRGDW